MYSPTFIFLYCLFIMMCFSCVISSNIHFPCSRPFPDFLYPPMGQSSEANLGMFTATLPACIFLASSSALLMSFVYLCSTLAAVADHGYCFSVQNGCIRILVVEDRNFTHFFTPLRTNPVRIFSYSGFIFLI